MAAPGGADSTAPPIMTEAAKLAEAPATQALSAPQKVMRLASLAPGSIAPRSPSLQREVFGFVNASNLGNPTVGYPSWDLSLLSTVAYFGLHVNSGDGNLVTNDTGWAIYHSATMSNFVNAAHAKGVRVIVSINLHDFSSDPNNQVCQGLISTNAQHTIDQSVAQMAAAGIDGINLNYEGTITTCANTLTNRDQLTAMVKKLRAAMPVGTYLAIDTFSGSAEDNQEFFDITGLAPYVDAFFVMAYDMDYANYPELPLSCTQYCFNPVSPLNTYRFNVTKSMAQYTALVPASKVILGQPYYGRRGCVGQGEVAHSNLVRDIATPTYLFASTIPSQTGVYSFIPHRDPGDGVSEWDTWYDTDWSCIREQYFDDVYSLGAKYDLAIRDNLAGVGLFTLDYGGGAPELWSTLRTYFSCPVTISLPASETTTQFSVGLSAGTCPVAYFDVQQYDNTLNQGWFALSSVPAASGSGTGVADGYPGYTYQFRARAHMTVGVVGAWSAIATTAVSSTATSSHPFNGVYTLDGWGGVHGDNSPPLNSSAYWVNWNIARAGHAMPGASSPQSGAVLDGYGGLHSYGAPITIATSAYWPGWDIARDFAFLPNGTGGVVLDGWGGLHPFHVNGSTVAITIQTTAYWPYWDIARKVVIFADGTGGYVLDGWGGLHPFGINGPPPVMAAKLATTGYWPWWDIARDVVLVPGDGGHSGYVLDGWGGVHPFHPTSDSSTMPAPISVSNAYWPGWDIARGIWLLPGSASAGYTLDGWGGLHPFGGAPNLVNTPYWPYWDIAKSIWGA
jgi:spore germination protein YaaH